MDLSKYTDVVFIGNRVKLDLRKTQQKKSLSKMVNQI